MEGLCRPCWAGASESGDGQVAWGPLFQEVGESPGCQPFPGTCRVRLLQVAWTRSESWGLSPLEDCSHSGAVSFPQWQTPGTVSLRREKVTPDVKALLRH